MTNACLSFKNLVICFLTFVCSIPFNSFAKYWTIQDKNLQITFNDQSLQLKVLDKRCNKVWEQHPLGSDLSLQRVSQKDNELTLHFTGKYTFEAQLLLTQNSELKVAVSADANMPMDELSFPSAFKSPAQHYLLLTDGEGLLLPVNDKNYPLGSGITYFCGGGLSMAWMGVTDKDFATGYMAMLETPYDAALRPKRENGAVTFAPVWLSSKEHFSYTRKLTYVFFNKGGYVAQCKRYRDYTWKKNNVVTLRENEKKTPAIAKMIGSVRLYVWDNARQVSFAKDLKQSGIDKALFLWDANHTPYPAIGFDDSLKALGFATGAYELFTDLHYKDSTNYFVDPNGPLRFAPTAYPGLFNALAARTKDGKTYFNQFGHTICPAAVQPSMVKRIGARLKEFPHEAYFLDVYQANGLFECYSPVHPLTRQQYAEQIVKNFNMVNEKYHQFMGGEWGADFTGSSSIFADGMMTLQRTWWGTESGKKGTIYYTGDWKNNSRPSQMLGIRTAPPLYMKYSINETIRVPLYELVYHDAIVTTWRWEDGNHHTPEIWWKKDLFNILYGTAPLWSLDKNRWEEFKNTFVQSYKNICPWLQQIGYDEMVSHRFVSPDRKVQETTFSSGKKAVVNFGEAPYEFEHKIIAARGFIFL